MLGPENWELGWSVVSWPLHVRVWVWV